MKKDYIYEDKGQFKLLQNATRIGGFYAGDQGIIPAERVLPERKFAHQPVLRRPPEEVVTVPYHYLPDSSGSADNEFLAYAGDTIKTDAGQRRIFKARGLVRLQEPTSAALDFEDKVFKQAPISTSDIVTFSAYFLALRWGRYTQGNIVGHPCIGFNYLDSGCIIVFKDQIFYMEGTADLVEDPGGTLCSQTGLRYLKQNEAYWVMSGKLDGGILVENPQKIPGIPYHDELFNIVMVYVENGIYYLVTHELKNTVGTYYVRYQSSSPGGPWSFSDTWWDSAQPPGSPPDSTLLALVQSKTIKELSAYIDNRKENDSLYDALEAVYGLDIVATGGVYGRGKDTELLRYAPGIKWSLGKRTSYKEIIDWDTKWKGQVY